MNKKTLTRVLLGLIAITTVATVIAYFVIKPDRPWMAFYVACCGGVLVFNFLISLFLVNKNLKSKNNMALFESYDRRIDHINAVLKEYGINGIEDAKAICDAKGIDPYTMCKETQPICFENACWAYVVGAAIAIKKGCTNAAEAAEAIGIGLQAFCIAGSVADDRKVGIGHGNLAARLLREETKCFAFLAGHESFAAAEGAIKIAEMANKSS